MKILAVESSCDETSAAVLSNGKILSNIIATQTIHAKYGGVIPEMASRLHMQHIIPVVEEALLKANTTLQEIDAFAFVQNPGLLGSLLVGACFIKSLALAYHKPLIAVNHIHAHITSNFIESTIVFPFLCLTVSGGHTQINLCEKINSYTLLGNTLDDAAGEAFDKCAKLLGLPYPGGILIDKYAEKGDENKFIFSKPKLPDLNYSFSGFKTAVLYFLQKEKQKDADFIKNNLSDLCASIQKTIVDILLDKFILAIEHYHIKNICLAGGVSANSKLRQRVTAYCNTTNRHCFMPKLEYCTDNAAMIAMNAYFKFLEKDFCTMDKVPTAN